MSALLCPTCSGSLREDHRFCPTCGVALDARATRTAAGHSPARTPPLSPTPASREARAGSGAARASLPASSQGRFVPGQLLLDRYRIVGLLGKGGMGEVYRADDLKLGQPVALKFLPEPMQQDPERLDRLFNEVRTARQVSHPAVCHVYDVAEVGGQHFLSMEYVDGENLASLLRRIGRLPGDKALEIARQVCAGLAAAHEKGVLHRDLKPENVMLDGRGKARLTDFGLAALQEAIESQDVRSGTPAYMSPEQHAGREVSPRSDVYALGLVLYELFTGRRAFTGKTLTELARQHQEEAPESPSTLVGDLDPAVERVILRCLEKDPQRRPPSALAVAASLPGGDPLAAALAAGETPSPELVAAAGQMAGVRPARAWAWVAAAAAAFVASVLVMGRHHVLSLTPVPKSPAVLEDRARELIRKLADADAPADHGLGLSVDVEYLRWARERDASPARWAGLFTGDPPLLQFWYRESPRPLVAQNTVGAVRWGDPPIQMSGMAGARLDFRGRLVAFYRVPPQLESEGAAPTSPEWAPLFAEAGLDPTRFKSVEPRWTPPFYCDARAAWEGAYPERPDIELRVEAAAYRGRPVAFHTVSPWTRPERMQPFRFTRGELLAQAFASAVLLGLMLAGGWLARRTLRAGRVDRRGAFRVAAFTFVVGVAAWCLLADHVRDRNGELGIAARGLGSVLLTSFVLWLFYLAVEPYMRRFWPHTLISWTRLLGGGVRDPLVGRDVLLGATWGAVLALLIAISITLPGWLGRAPSPPFDGQLALLLGLRTNVGLLLTWPLNATASGLGALLGLLLMRLMLRREVAAAVALALMLGVPWGLGVELPWWLGVPLGLLTMGSLAAVLLRFGLLACVAGLLVADQILSTPVAVDLSAWTAPPTIFTALVLAAVVGYGLMVSLGGRSPFGGEAGAAEPDRG